MTEALLKGKGNAPGLSLKGEGVDYRTVGESLRGLGD